MLLRSRSPWPLIITSIIVALLLTLLPLPLWVQWYRPHWLALVIIYWAMMAPQCIGIGSAWLLGLLLDIANGTVLGEHALALTVITFFVIKLYRQMKMFPLYQQSVAILLLILIYLLLIFLTQGFQGERIDDVGFWFSSLISALVWPCVLIILNYFNGKAGSRYHGLQYE